jgi:hypothetical protein
MDQAGWPGRCSPASRPRPLPLRRSATTKSPCSRGGRGSSPCAAISWRGRPRPRPRRGRRRARAGRRCSLSSAGASAGSGDVEGEDVGAVVLAQPAAAAVVEQRMPLVPGAAFVAVLQPADQGEGTPWCVPRRPAAAASGRRTARRWCRCAQRLAVAHQRAAAEAADRTGRRGRGELDRRAAVRAGGAR